MIKLPEPAKRPTMYFVGVTTGQSSIMKMFPIWAKELGLDAEIKGIDLPIHAPAEDYRAAARSKTAYRPSAPSAGMAAFTRPARKAVGCAGRRSGSGRQGSMPSSSSPQ